MRLPILLMVMVACACATGGAAAPRPFMSVAGETSQPIGHHEFCALHPSECAVTSPSAAHVTLTPERWGDLLAVNAAVNRTIAATTDQQLFGRPEVWVYPETRGDCEDLVLLKRQMLMRRGWPVGALLITVVRQASGEGHAVLTVVTDRGDLVLDNLEDAIALWSETPYHYIKRQSPLHAGRWTAIDDARDPRVGSVQP